MESDMNMNIYLRCLGNTFWPSESFLMVKKYNFTENIMKHD
jgi:hypothetical protein